jgi:CHAT domain-containing protein
MSATLDDARSESIPAGGAESVALVAAPTASVRLFPTLQPLTHARDEVASIARLYPSASIDSGASSSAGTIAARLQHGQIFHFAGHAIFDDARPGASALVIDSATISAANIEKMQLRGLQLVVLSACESMRGSGTPGAGFSGFSDAFLSAGAGGVVGSFWRVDDADAAAFMLAFHESYARSRDASGALRAAQLRFVRRPPYTWGAFSYVGR